VNFSRSACVRWSLSVALAGIALGAAVAANAQVTWSIGTDEPAYYEPAPTYQAPPPDYYEPAPPAYYRPPPTYYQPPAYYQPPPSYYGMPAPVYREPGYWQGPRGAEQPRLSDMQQRALDNCSMLAWRDQRRCRATVMSTVR